MCVFKHELFIDKKHNINSAVYKGGGKSCWAFNGNYYSYFQFLWQIAPCFLQWTLLLMSNTQTCKALSHADPSPLLPACKEEVDAVAAEEVVLVVGRSTHPPTHPLCWHPSEQDPCTFCFGLPLCLQLLDRVQCGNSAVTMTDTVTVLFCFLVMMIVLE